MNKRKTATAVAVVDPPDRQIAFRAPDVVHGGLKEIIGRLERVSYRIDGKSVSGQDVLSWLIGELYMEGPDKWPSRVTKAEAALAVLDKQGSPPEQKKTP